MNIDTLHLRLFPVDLEQFQTLIYGVAHIEEIYALNPSNVVFDDDTCMAMEYMYSIALKHADEYLWYTNWQIVLKSENRLIGSMGFKNAPKEKDGEVEIGYGLYQNEYKNRGYMTEAVTELCRWAFRQPGVNSVIAETYKNNYASQSVLTKVGFIQSADTEESIWWMINKQNLMMKENDITIRQEKKQDYDEIYNLIRTAFETAKVKDGDEQDFAVKLRNSEKYIPNLALVAERNNELVGHIMLTRTVVKQPNGDEYEALLVAPLSVLLDYRNIGVGSALMNRACEIARDLGYKAVFLCGDPDYYNRFGFVSSVDYGIENENDVPSQYCLALELFPDALKGVTGTINCV